MENGRVLTGFSHPVVAQYQVAAGKVTYTNGRPLGRGVKCALSLTTADGNDFYADDVLAESDNGVFSGGTATITVDGMHPDADRFVLGIPDPEEVTYGESLKTKVTRYGAAAKPPYLGYGHIATYQSGGVEIFVPHIFPKVKFRQPGFDGETRGEKKSFQTQELTADLHRDDTANKDWKWIGEDFDTKAEALAVLHGLLNVTVTEVSNG